MARYKDVENIRKLFDNEYKSTRKLINEGETHLDNLAEGFSEATRVLDMIPTADVVPRSEIEQAKQEVARELIDLITEILMNNTKSTMVGDKAILEIHENIFDRLAELEKEYIGEVTGDDKR